MPNYIPGLDDSDTEGEKEGTQQSQGIMTDRMGKLVLEETNIKQRYAQMMGDKSKDKEKDDLEETTIEARYEQMMKDKRKSKEEEV